MIGRGFEPFAAPSESLAGPSAGEAALPDERPPLQEASRSAPPESSWQDDARRDAPLRAAASRSQDAPAAGDQNGWPALDPFQQSWPQSGEVANDNRCTASMTCAGTRYELRGSGNRRYLVVQRVALGRPVDDAQKIALQDIRRAKSIAGDSSLDAVKNFLVYTLAVVLTGGFALIVIFLLGLRYDVRPSAVELVGKKTTRLSFRTLHAMQRFSAFLEREAGIKVVADDA